MSTATTPLFAAHRAVESLFIRVNGMVRRFYPAGSWGYLNSKGGRLCPHCKKAIATIADGHVVVSIIEA